MNKTVLITGASSGIGKTAALLFHQQGWKVAATMRSPGRVTDLPEGERLFCLPLDVTDAPSIETGVQQAIQRFGSLDVVVNNAGYAAVGPFEAASEEQIYRQFDTNVYGILRLTKAVLPHFRERRQGVFVNVASMGGRITFPLYSLYHGTKWALEGFSESLQYELQPFGIRVKIVEPGLIRTDFYGRSADVLSADGLTAYDDYVGRLLPAMNKAAANGASPEAVAETIYKAATDGRRRMRYPVGTRGILKLRRLLPDLAFMGLVRKALGN